MRRLSVLCFLLLALAVVVELGLDYGRTYQSCSGCGARSRVRHLRLFGLGGEYGRVIDEGYVSRFVQEQLNVECTHTWELYDGYWGSLLSRAAGSGRGLVRHQLTVVLDGWLLNGEGSSLEELAASEPDFSRRFITLIRDPRNDESEFQQWVINRVSGLPEPDSEAKAP